MESFRGFVNSPNDALLLFEACRLNRLKRIQRRLSESERLNQVCSGAVFLWDEEESGIKRWTDGKHWSPSRINGSFLIYREVEPRKHKLPGSNEEKIEYVIKEDGLTKKAISISTAQGRKQHLVSYYTRDDLNNKHPQLMSPSELDLFQDVVISSDIYPEFMPENMQPCSSSIRSSAASISSSGSVSSLPASIDSSNRPNYVPVKYRFRSTTRDTSPYRSDRSDRNSITSTTTNTDKRSSTANQAPHPDDYPRPSQDSGKHHLHAAAPIDSTTHDNRFFRSYDSQSIRSYDTHRSHPDNYSIRSFKSLDAGPAPPSDEQWHMPLHHHGAMGPSPDHHQQQQQHHQGYKVIVHNDQQHSNPDSPPYMTPTHSSGGNSNHRSPSIISSISHMTAPADLDRHHLSSSSSSSHKPSSSSSSSHTNNPLMHHHHHHHHPHPHRSSPNPTPSVRSLPLPHMDHHTTNPNNNTQPLILPPPKPTDPHTHYQPTTTSNNPLMNKQPMFLAHLNWTPDTDYSRRLESGAKVDGASAGEDGMEGVEESSGRYY